MSRLLSRLRSLLVRLPLRLLAFNVLLVVLPASGVYYLDVYERQLLAAQERSMVQQGRLLAATLAARPDVSTEEVERLLRSLDRQTTARLRVLNHDGWLIADSSRLGPRREGADAALPPAPARETRLYRLGATLYRSLGRVLLGPRPAPEPAEERWASDQRYEGAEISEALAGRYGAAYRVSPGQRSVTLYSALPVQSERGVAGVVLVSQSTLRILEDLYEVRLAIFRVFLLSLLLALALSVLVSLTIGRPLARLAESALALLDQRGRLRGRLRASRRRDEIGDLERALAELSRRLVERERFVASFVADLVHELKNPLASIRAASEVAADSEEAAERAALLATVDREVARLEGLLGELREVTRLDEEEAAVAPTQVDLAQLVRGAVASRRLRGEPVEIELAVSRVVVRGFADALGRAIENVLDNAIGFSPPAATVRVTVAAEGDEAVVRFDDDGPGIPEEHLDQLFDRFFSYRPGGRELGHSGLGLAIVRRTVEHHGGRVVASNRQGGGARFELRLPLGASRAG